MVLKLYGTPRSPNAQRAAMVLKEKSVPYEFVVVDMPKREHKSPAYLEKHPFGQVPYMDDDGYILYESRAIARYVALKYKDQGTPLVPDQSDLQATGKFEQAASIEFSNFNVFVSQLVGEKLFSSSPNEEKIASLRASLEGKLDAYEAILSKSKYLAGDELTLADLFHIPFGSFLVGRLEYDYLEDPAKRPNVARWWKDITSRPSWQAVKAGVPVE